MDKYWKRTERRLARVFGTRRTPCSGSNSGGTRSDSLHDRLYIEAKCRKKLPGWFKELVIDTEIKAAKEGKVPLVLLHEKGQKNKKDYCICRLEDIMAIAKEVK